MLIIIIKYENTKLSKTLARSAMFPQIFSGTEKETSTGFSNCPQNKREREGERERQR